MVDRHDPAGVRQLLLPPLAGEGWGGGRVSIALARWGAPRGSGRGATLSAPGAAELPRGLPGLLEGRVRLLRGQARAPVDKPSRPVRCGDVLSFAQGPRWVAVKVEALGERRGPAPEARALYSALTDAGGGATGADIAPKTAGRAVEGGDFNHTRG